MNYSIDALATLVGGKLEGDGDIEISAARPVSEAGPHDITFAEDDRNVRLLKQSRAAAAVVGLATQVDGLPLIRSENPRRAFGMILQRLLASKATETTGIHPQASIAPSARLGSEASVGPFVSIGEGVVIGERCRLMPGVVIGDGCLLGDDVVLHPRVVLYAGTRLGSRVIAHAGVVIGADGFGYYQDSGRHAKDWQLGHVEIGDDVEIGANTTIDRATFYATRIGEGTKIDNLAMIAHNCQIGRHNLIVGQVGIAGSSTTGDYVVLAGQVGIGDHIAIGDGATIGARSAVMKDVPAGARMIGVPATPDREQYLLHITLRKLPESLKELRASVSELTRQIQEIEERTPPQRKSA